METSFSGFSQVPEDRKKVLSTSSVSLLATTIAFTALLILFRNPLSVWMALGKHPDYIVYFAFILAFDTLTAIPFVNLRLQNRPVKYSTIKIVNIGLNVSLNLFFLVACPWLLQHGHHWVSLFYNPYLGVVYIFIVNLIASLVTWLLLLPEIIKIEWKVDVEVWKTMMRYSLPLIIVGLAGMVNEPLTGLFSYLNFFPTALKETIF